VALTGFPDQIRVVFGSNWDGTKGNGLGPGGDEELILKRVGVTDVWTESGEAAVDSSSNRIKFIPSSSGEKVKISLTSLSSWHNALTIWVSGTEYTFLDVWNGVTGFVTLSAQSVEATSWVPTVNLTFYSPFSTPNAYNPKTFSTMEQYEPPSGRGPDKTTYRYG